MGQSLEESSRSPSKWGTPPAWGRGTAGRGCAEDPPIPAWFVPGAAGPERGPERCQPPPSSNLFPDYVSLDKRELFRALVSAETIRRIK